MPFTFSHPAAAVPLARWGLPISALAVGSMAPDFPYFLLLSTERQFAHSLVGVFVFCVPASLAVLWLWHRVLDVPLNALLPSRFRCDIAKTRFHFGPSRRFSLIIVAIICGALTHLAWDSFTHANGFMASHWNWLQTSLYHGAHGTLRLCKVLQHASSVGGLILVLHWLRRAAKVEPDEPTHKSVAALLCVGSFVGAFGYAMWRQTALQQPKIEAFARDFAVMGVMILLVEISLWSVWWRARNQPYNF